VYPWLNISGLLAGFTAGGITYLGEEIGREWTLDILAIISVIVLVLTIIPMKTVFSKDEK